MRKDLTIWFGCILLFCAGTVWGLAHKKRDFFQVANLHDFFDIFGAIATIAAVVLAALSLNAWKKQKRAEASHDLARQVLVSVYEYREVIKAVRNPMIMSYEIAPEAGEQPSADPMTEKFHGELRAYQRRLARIEPVRVRLLAYSLEAQVVWGNDIKEVFSLLLMLENQIGMYLRSYFISRSPLEADDFREAHKNILKKKRNPLVDGLFEGVDEFTRDMDYRFEAMEKILRGKMIQ